MVGWKALFVGSLALAAVAWAAQSPETTISKKIGTLRGLPDAQRAVTTKQLALDIRALPGGAAKLGLAQSLANLSTEGDFGRDTLQEVTTTLATALKERKAQATSLHDDPALVKAIYQELDFAYQELAQLDRYEHMKIGLADDSQYTEALAKLDAIDAQRAKVDFTLTDLAGKTWTRSALKGKVVLVNFWATWCPPCRKEMPDLNALYDRFKAKGFVILAISDEKTDVVSKFIREHKYTYPILLDPGRKVNTDYQVMGIPKSFLYDRTGKMIAQTIDMRTQKQFLELLAKAGLK